MTKTVHYNSWHFSNISSIFWHLQETWDYMGQSLAFLKGGNGNWKWSTQKAHVWPLDTVIISGRSRGSGGQGVQLNPLSHTCLPSPPPLEICASRLEPPLIQSLIHQTLPYTGHYRMIFKVTGIPTPQWKDPILQLTSPSWCSPCFSP